MCVMSCTVTVTGTVKITMLSEARAKVGTCPDLCPEKERYRREDTRRLSWFEVCRDSTTGGRVCVALLL